MSSSSGRAAVRMALLTFLAVAFVVSLLGPAQAGTQASPEITDPSGDWEIQGLPLGSIPLPLAQSADLVAGWIEENATHLIFNVQAAGDIESFPGGIGLASFAYNVHFVVGATEVTGNLEVGFGSPTPGAAADAGSLNGSVAIISIPKSALPVSTAGTVLAGIHLEAIATLLTAPLESETDIAPDAGAAAGILYTITGGGAPPPDPNDTDGDGLNDTCEMQYFGNLTAQNATGDADNDTVSNQQECANGTDPTDADSDNDGIPDGQDARPNDPSNGNSTTTTTSRSTSTSRTSTTSTSTSRTTTTSSTTSSDDSIENLDDAIEALKSDLGYLGGSAGGLVAVLALCILALAVRWSL